MVTSAGSLSILVVCDGNVCRSPSAQSELRLRLPGARVESAGMHAVHGTTMCGVAAEEAGDDFVDRFRSRRMSEVALDDFDVTLTATAQLRSELTRSAPHLRDRFFTLIEAADVLAEFERSRAGSPTEPFTAAELVAELNGYRGAPPVLERLSPRLRLHPLDDHDIPDAHGLRPKRHRAVIELARRSAASVGDSLARVPLR